MRDLLPGASRGDMGRVLYPPVHGMLHAEGSAGVSSAVRQRLQDARARAFPEEAYNFVVVRIARNQDSSWPPVADLRK